MEFSAAVFLGEVGLPGLWWVASDVLCGGVGCYVAVTGVGKFGSISLTNGKIIRNENKDKYNLILV